MMKILKVISMGRMFVIFFIFGIAGLSCNLEVVPPMTDAPTPIPDPTKQVASNSLALVEKWRWSGSIYNLFGPPVLIISNSRVVIASPKRSTGKKVTVFDANTGDITWVNEDIKNMGSFNVDDKYVYVGSSRSVQAYDLNTGQIVWEEVIKRGNRGEGRFDVYPKGGEIQGYNFTKDRLYLLDPETGETFDEIDQPGLFFKEDNIIYYSKKCIPDRCLVATDVSNGERLWSRNTEGGFFRWPVFINGTMLINIGGKLFSIESKSGEIVWQSTDSNFITTIASGDGLLYVVRNDAAIVGFEPETGKQMGLIEMNPNQAPRDNGVSSIYYYTIAASDKFVAVYYGNSNELIVFEKVNS